MGNHKRFWLSGVQTQRLSEVGQTCVYGQYRPLDPSTLLMWVLPIQILSLHMVHPGQRLPLPTVSYQSGGPFAPPSRRDTNWFFIGHHPSFVDKICVSMTSSCSVWERSLVLPTSDHWPTSSCTVRIHRSDSSFWSRSSSFLLQKLSNIDTCPIYLDYPKWSVDPQKGPLSGRSRGVCQAIPQGSGAAGEAGESRSPLP